MAMSHMEAQRVTAMMLGDKEPAEVPVPGMKFEIRRDPHGDKVTVVIDLQDGAFGRGCCPEFIEIRRNGALVGQVIFNVAECQVDWEAEIAKARLLLSFPNRLRSILQEFAKDKSDLHRKELIDGFITAAYGKSCDSDEMASWDWSESKKRGAQIVHHLWGLAREAFEKHNQLKDAA